MFKNLIRSEASAVNIFRDGTTVFEFYGWDANGIESWVRSVAALSEQAVDWSYFCGGAVVKSLGDLNSTRNAIIHLLPELNAGIKGHALAKYGRFFQDEIPPLDAEYEAADVTRYNI